MLSKFSETATRSCSISFDREPILKSLKDFEGFQNGFTIESSPYLYHPFLTQSLFHANRGHYFTPDTQRQSNNRGNPWHTNEHTFLPLQFNLNCTRSGIFVFLRRVGPTGFFCFGGPQRQGK